MARVHLSILLFSFVSCKVGSAPYNPDIQFSQAWWDTIILRCALQQSSECIIPAPAAIYFPEIVSDTGQSICYDGTTNVICPDVLFPSQDADFVNVPSMRSYTGPVINSVYTNDYTTLDNVRGLVWKSCPEGLSGSTCGVGATTAVSFSVASGLCSNLNAQNSGAGYAGITSWRLPSIYELARMSNVETVSGVDSMNFPGSPTVITFFSSTPYAPNPTTTGWYVQIVNPGFYNELNYGTGPFSVRCVSGPSLFNHSLINNGNGTVTDNRTGLVWQDGAGGGNNTWQGALATCSALGLAGLSWRLPNAHELHSIVDYSGPNPAIDTGVFPGTTAQYYWTSSTNRFNLSFAWAVFFASGLMGGNGKGANLDFRCVSGP
ncbi:DUF1566 domain-containing protein [Leptospira sp. WS92.C1]